MFNDGTAKGSIRKMTDFAKNNALPVGFEYFTFNSNVAVGSLPYLGSEYSRSAYADLWSWANEVGYVITEAEWQEKYAANNGNVPYYSDGDGSTTFRVPSINISFDTVQPESIVGIWCVIAFGTITNTGSQDVEQISQGLSNVEGRISELENSFAIIYPNGGTEESPAEVTIDSRYVEENPFPGYYVKCEAQILYEGQWGATGWGSNAYQNVDRSFGIQAHQLLPDDTIIVRTGIEAVMLNISLTGAPFGGEKVALTSAPCRVLVHKLGKIGE